MKNIFPRKWVRGFFMILLVAAISGCGGGIKIPPPTKVTAPAPIEGNTGKYMSPCTSDDVLAKWVDKAIGVKAGAAVGRAVGAYAGRKLLEQVPFIGGILGSTIGEAAGRAIAIKGAGGMEYIKQTSDISFNSPHNMALYLYAKHTKHKDYKAALDATFGIYPELQKAYYPALINAGKCGKARC